MKLARPSVELAVLRGACNKDKRIAGTILGQIDDSYFHFPESVEVYHAIRKHMTDSGESPTYRLLIDDPGLSEGARQHLRDSEAVVTTIPEANKAVASLNKYRQARSLFNIAASINDSMQASKVDIDQLLEQASLSLSDARSRKSSKQSFVHFGVNNNSLGRIKSILYEDRSEQIIPSTIEAFDEVAKGFTRGSLVTLGASSGGGKSLMANAMALGMAKLGYRVLVVPLEMTEDEMTCRAMANITGYDLTSILTQGLATGEKALAEKRMRRWMRQVREAGGRYTLYKPEQDMTLEEVYAATAAFEYDVTILDYISLLKGTDGEDMWRALGATARYGKINAGAENRLNILLCQVDETGKVRYSRAISEHCVTGDTLVDTDRGLVRIDSLYPDAQVMSTRPLKGVRVKSEGVYRKASHVHYNGVRTVFELTLGNGKSIRCTSQHRFKHLTEKGKLNWEKLQDLRTGDWIAVDHGESKFAEEQVSLTIPRISYHANTLQTLPASIKIDENLAYVLGCLSSDGYLGKHGVNFIASDINIMRKFKGSWAQVFGENTLNIKSQNDNGTRVAKGKVPIWRAFTNRAIGDFLLSIEGMRGHARNKCAPDVIMRSPKSVILSYLAGLFDGDGSITKVSGSVHSVSPMQRKRVQILLGMLGLKSRNARFTVTMCGKSLAQFLSQVPVTEAKQIHPDKEALVTRDPVPRFMFADLLQAHVKQKSLRLKQRVIEGRALISKLVNADCTYYQYEELGNLYFDKVETAKRHLTGTYLEGQLDEIAEVADFTRFEKIVSIKKLGEEKVYDLTVPGTHSYVADGIVVHNSNNSWVWVASPDDKETGIITIQQPKSRNSRAFPFRVRLDYAHMRVESAPNDDALGSISDAGSKDGKTAKDGSSIKPKRKNLPNLAADI